MSPSFSIYNVLLFTGHDFQKLLRSLPKQNFTEAVQNQKHVVEYIRGIVRISKNLSYCSHLNILTDLHSNLMFM